MEAHSSILAWRVPWGEEPQGLQSMGSQRIEHNWETECSQHNTLNRVEYPVGDKCLNAAAFCGWPRFNPWVGKSPWRRQWHPTPVVLPRKSHGQRRLVGYSPWGRKESDTTEWLHFSLFLLFGTWLSSHWQQLTSVILGPWVAMVSQILLTLKV